MTEENQANEPAEQPNPIEPDAAHEATRDAMAEAASEGPEDGAAVDGAHGPAAATGSRKKAGWVIGGLAVVVVAGAGIVATQGGSGSPAASTADTKPAAVSIPAPTSSSSPAASLEPSASASASTPPAPATANPAEAVILPVTAENERACHNLLVQNQDYMLAVLKNTSPFNAKFVLDHNDALVAFVNDTTSITGLDDVAKKFVDESAKLKASLPEAWDGKKPDAAALANPDKADPADVAYAENYLDVVDKVSQANTHGFESIVGYCWANKLISETQWDTYTSTVAKALKRAGATTNENAVPKPTPAA